MARAICAGISFATLIAIVGSASASPMFQYNPDPISANRAVSCEVGSWDDSDSSFNESYDLADFNSSVGCDYTGIPGVGTSNASHSSSYGPQAITLNGSTAGNLVFQEEFEQGGFAAGTYLSMSFSLNEATSYALQASATGSWATSGNTASQGEVVVQLFGPSGEIVNETMPAPGFTGVPINFAHFGELVPGSYHLNLSFEDLMRAFASPDVSLIDGASTFSFSLVIPEPSTGILAAVTSLWMVVFRPRRNILNQFRR